MEGGWSGPLFGEYDSYRVELTKFLASSGSHVSDEEKRSEKVQELDHVEVSGRAFNRRSQHHKPGLFLLHLDAAKLRIAGHAGDPLLLLVHGKWASQCPWPLSCSSPIDPSWFSIRSLKALIIKDSSNFHNFCWKVILFFITYSNIYHLFIIKRVPNFLNPVRKTFNRTLCSFI